MWISCVYNTLNVDKYGVAGVGGPLLLTEILVFNCLVLYSSKYDKSKNEHGTRQIQKFQSGEPDQGG
ncbi:hypothetical protein J3D43_003009 [Paenibacillus xylanexedens]|nr:hypothetical protein [Paenibacillus xylanexedens]